MNATTYARGQDIWSHDNLCLLFQETSTRYSDAVAFRVEGDGREVTWKQAQCRVENIARGMHALGVRADDVVAMLMPNVPEFHLVDLAVLHLGAVPFSLYLTDPPEKMSAQLRFCDVSVLVADASYVGLAQQLRETTEGVDLLIAAGDCAAATEVGISTMTLAGLERLGSESDVDYDETWRAVPGDATASILFTSGTTGEPKAVQLPHRAILASLAHYAEAAPVTPQGRVLSYLPAAHIADRFASHYSAIAFGHTITCVPDHATLFADIRAVRPTHFFTVPRVLEKLMESVVGLVHSEPHLVEKFESRVRVIENGDPVEAFRLEADEFRSIRTHVGLDEAEWLTVGSAPSARGALVALAAAGLPFADIWGMSEIIVCTMNPPGGIRLGSIGKAFSRVDLTLADDGELFARGPNMFTGYRNDIERTADAMVDDWVRTGDLAKIDEDGYVWIIGRKKEIMISAAGKNLTPLRIEGAIQVESPLIDYVAAVGDGRRYVTAILALDPQQVRTFAAAAGLDSQLPYQDLLHHPEVQSEISGAIERGNQNLSRAEQVRAWTVVDDEWVTGGEFITGSMKLMRDRVIVAYQHVVEEMYLDKRG